MVSAVFGITFTRSYQKFLKNLLMGLSSEYCFSSHYSDNRGYLIFYCHRVARTTFYESIKLISANKPFLGNSTNVLESS